MKRYLKLIFAGSVFAGLVSRFAYTPPQFMIPVYVFLLGRQLPIDLLYRIILGRLAEAFPPWSPFRNAVFALSEGLFTALIVFICALPFLLAFFITRKNAVFVRFRKYYFLTGFFISLISAFGSYNNYHFEGLIWSFLIGLEVNTFLSVLLLFTNTAIPYFLLSKLSRRNRTFAYFFTPFWLIGIIFGWSNAQIVTPDFLFAQRVNASLGTGVVFLAGSVIFFGILFVCLTTLANRKNTLGWYLSLTLLLGMGAGLFDSLFSSTPTPTLGLILDFLNRILTGLVIGGIFCIIGVLPFTGLFKLAGNNQAVKKAVRYSLIGGICIGVIFALIAASAPEMQSAFPPSSRFIGLYLAAGTGLLWGLVMAVVFGILAYFSPRASQTASPFGFPSASSAGSAGSYYSPPQRVKSKEYLEAVHLQGIIRKLYAETGIVVENTHKENLGLRWVALGNLLNSNNVRNLRSRKKWKEYGEKLEEIKDQLEMLKKEAEHINIVHTGIVDKEMAFEELGIDPNSTFDQVRSVYRRLALKWHPDRNPSPDADEKFTKINLAYEFLDKLYNQSKP